MRFFPRSVILVSAVLLLNMLLALLEGPGWMVGTLFLAAPFLVVWMVLRVLREPDDQYPELPPGDAWGYRDRPELRPVQSNGIDDAKH